jgi:peptidase E
MTKYILNSGGLKKYPQKAIKFNREIINGLGKNPKILCCFFAQSRESWEEKFSDYTKRFLELINKNIEPKFTLAFPDKFIEQIKDNDIVIIYGGDDNLLMFWLKQYDLPAIWQDKIVVGSSAGADALVKNFWARDWRRVISGLGILPIKFIPHYKAQDNFQDPIDWEGAYHDLSVFGDKNLPIYALEEGDFIIIEK